MSNPINSTKKWANSIYNLLYNSYCKKRPNFMDYAIDTRFMLSARKTFAWTTKITKNKTPEISKNSRGFFTSKGS